MTPITTAAFAAMPLDDQLTHLRRARAAQPAEDLLALCASIRDSAPLAWLCRALLEDRWLAEPTHRTHFAGFLIEQPETSVLKILKELVGVGSETLRGHFRDMLLEALLRVPVSRLSTMCQIDRALKHNFPEDRDRHVAQVIERCGALLAAGQIDAVTVDLLAQVPARAIPALQETARATGVLPTFEARRRALATQAIAVLGNAPKAVSQANAEELLSRRVYTDPGHFLIELLQNAEDSGATIWRVAFEGHRVIVWHNGTPFDARDLVGVTSIGQTTKRKQQIGFFGVGFKSVYEITDRPRIYSDVFQFEIADVSIPKGLAERPADLPADGTVLVLPLRDPKDAVRSPRALYEKARALDPCVLFTLRGIDVIELTLDAAGGGPDSHAVHEIAAPDMSMAVIRQEPKGWTRAYAIQDDTYAYPLGAREAGRPDATQIMVGVMLDEAHKPIPLPEEASTVYSYLPTHESSGLRFFVQGHFDVPVDRERVTQDSAWNRWILRHVPTQLARVATQLIQTAQSPEDAQNRALGMLDVLPLAPEMGSPIFKTVPFGLSKALEDVPLLPCTDGRLHPPSEVVVVSESIAGLFGDDPIDPRLLDASAAPGALFMLDPGVPERTAKVAAVLGCKTLDNARLLTGLERGLEAVTEGGTPEAPWLPACLRTGALEGLLALYDLLLEDLEDMERGRRTLALNKWTERLSELPIWPGEAGGFHRANGDLARGASDLRAVYQGLRPFLDARLDTATQAAEPRAARAVALLDRLAVPTIQYSTLVADLERALDGHKGVLQSPQDARIPGTEARLEQILTLMVDAPQTLQVRLAELPLFRADTGVFYPAAREDTDTQGVLLTPQGPLTDQLRAFYAGQRPLLDPKASAAAALLDRLQTPELGFETLLNDLSRPEPLFDLDPARVQGLHALLEAIRDEIPSRARRTLLGLPIWPDTQNNRRPLKGTHPALIPIHDDLCTLLPDAPFLHPDVRRRKHLQGIDVDKIGVPELIDALADNARPPMAISRTPATIESVLRFLLKHGGRLGQRSTDKLAELPAFLNDRGQIRPLIRLSIAVDAPLRAIYGDFLGRNFIDPKGLSAQVIHKLGLSARLSVADADALIDDLGALSDKLRDKNPDVASIPILGKRAGLDAALGWLAGQTPHMTRDALTRAISLPIYPDHAGRLGPLGDLREALDPASVQPSRPGLRTFLVSAGYRALDSDAQTVLTPLLRAVDLPLADIKTAVTALATLAPVPEGQTGAPIQTPARLADIQRLLIDHREDLLASHPPQPREGLDPCNPALNRLPIWSTAAGTVVSADALVLGHDLAPLFAPNTPERRQLDAHSLADTTHLDALAPLMAPGPDAHLLATLIEGRAKNLQPLDTQPDFLSTIPKVHRALSILCHGVDTTPTICPLVDASPTPRLRLERLSLAMDAVLTLTEGLPVSGELLHPDFGALPEVLDKVLKPIQTFDILTAVVESDTTTNPRRRARFYQWLVTAEREIFTEPACRELLAESPLFMTERGSFLAPQELVIDPDLPDLGIDWRPHPDIPTATLDLLVRHLDAGRPPIEELVDHHLRPALIEATQNTQQDRAAQILTYLARQLGDRSENSLRRLLRPEGAAPLHIEDHTGAFRAPEDLLLPDDTLASFVHAVWPDAAVPRPAPERYPAQMRRFLIKLGVRDTPDLTLVAKAMTASHNPPRALMGLAGLVGHLFSRDPDGVLQTLPLTTAPWIVDGQGAGQKPGALFRWAMEIEALVGGQDDFPDQYPAEGTTELLGEPLMKHLGFKTARNVTLDDVVQHIDYRAGLGQPIPYRVYHWMEKGLTDGWLDRHKLHLALKNKPWICTDDGQYFASDKVLGTLALALFGTRRGYWTWGRSNCPTLCDLFKIAADVEAEDVASFLTEIGKEAQGLGDQVVLDQTPGLARNLLNCYAILGESDHAISRALPIVLCSERGQKDGASLPGSMRLMPAITTSLLRSDTPTLEALFEEVGTMHLTSAGPERDRAAIDRFYERMGIARLRDAYTVAVDGQAGGDITAQRGPQIGAMRGLFRALVEVLPRVRLQRTMLLEEGWVVEDRLKPLGGNAPIRAVEQLRVRYVLRGVGSVRTKVAAVYNPHRGELLVDARVAAQPEAHTLGLAMGLMPCIYDGPGEDQLVDTLELLVPQKTAARMHAYLDRRHFPRTTAARSGEDLLAERLGELLDYGLHHKLARRFEALGDKDFEVWREPSLMARLSAQDGDRGRMAARTASLLLDALGVTEPPEALVGALETLFEVDSLNDLPADFLRIEGEDEVLPPIEAIERGGRAKVSGNIHTPSGHVLDDLLRDLAARRRGRADLPIGIPPGRMAAAPDPFKLPGGERQPGRKILEKLAEIDRTARPADSPAPTWTPPPAWRSDDTAPDKNLLDEAIEQLPESDLGTDAPRIPIRVPEPVEIGREPSLWDKFTSWLGVSETPVVTQAVPLPDWAQPGTNSLAPTTGIGPQLWATPETVRAVVSAPTIAGLTFEPKRLPVPYLYAVQTFGATFHTEGQRWSRDGMPGEELLAKAKASGQSVVFEGRLMPGVSQLPIPLYGQLRGWPEVVGGDPDALTGVEIEPSGLCRATIQGDGPVLVRYEVDLMEVPSLTQGEQGAVEVDATLRTPTVVRGRLPRPVQNWLEEIEATQSTPWAKAIAVQRFVQQRYVYDEDFMGRPSVVHKLSELRPGRGHHHLEVLHAGADSEFLGRGICYELNSLVVELLRHLGVAAAVATGWVLDRGRIDRPDHLFAVAILPSMEGPSLFPLDAATGRMGPLRPLDMTPEVVLPDESPTLPERPPVPAPTGPWSAPAALNAPSEESIADLVASLSRSEEARGQEDIAVLVHLIEHICKVRKITVPAQVQALANQKGDSARRAQMLRVVAERLLGTSARVGAMMRLLREELHQFTTLPPAIQELVRMGLVEVRTVPVYEVVPTGAP